MWLFSTFSTTEAQREAKISIPRLKKSDFLFSKQFYNTIVNFLVISECSSTYRMF